VEGRWLSRKNENAHAETVRVLVLASVFGAALALTIAFGPLPELTQLADHPRPIKGKHGGWPKPDEPAESTRKLSEARILALQESAPPPHQQLGAHAGAHSASQEKSWGKKLVTNPQDLFSLVLTIFAGISICIAVWHGVHMRGQVRQASMQVKRLRQTIKTMRDAEQRELRAYVVVKDMGIINVHGDPPPQVPGHPPPKLYAFVVNPQSGPEAFLTFINSGKTPARQVEIAAGICFHEYPLSSPLPPLEMAGERQAAVLGPSVGANVVRQLPRRLTSAEIIRLQQGTAAIYFYGLITYVDAYGVARRTDFRLMCHAIGGTIGFNTSLNFCADGNDAT
jgi:hypothetical protein